MEWPTQTNILGLKRHTLSDDFQIQDYTDNWLVLDPSPGIFICTSGTRPATWGSAQEGRLIFEKDTTLLWRWSGTEFVLSGPKGTVAHDGVLTPQATTLTTYSAAVSAPSATYSTRRHLVVVEAPGVYSTRGAPGCGHLTEMPPCSPSGCRRGATDIPAANQPRPLSFVTTDLWAGGTAVYSLQFKAVIGYGGTCTVDGTHEQAPGDHGG